MLLNLNLYFFKDDLKKKGKNAFATCCSCLCLLLYFFFFMYANFLNDMGKCRISFWGVSFVSFQ